MKLLTLNCHSWQEENQLDKIKYIAKTIAENQYDVIALQEVSQHIDAETYKGNLKKDNFLVLLLEELKALGAAEYDTLWDYAHIGYDVYEEGVCLLSKHPVVEKESFYVSNDTSTTNWKTRKVTGFTIEYQEKLIDFYSCHLGWWHDTDEPFKTHIDNLYRKLPISRTAFIMGDFNNSAFIKDEGYDYVKSLGLYDTYELAEEKDDGITVKGKIAGWEKNKQDLRLDIIMTNHPISVKYSKVIFNGDYKDIVSDHYGVEVEIDDTQL